MLPWGLFRCHLGCCLKRSPLPAPASSSAAEAGPAQARSSQEARCRQAAGQAARGQATGQAQGSSSGGGGAAPLGPRRCSRRGGGAGTAAPQGDCFLPARAASGTAGRQAGQAGRRRRGARRRQGRQGGGGGGRAAPHARPPQHARSQVRGACPLRPPLHRLPLLHPCCQPPHWPRTALLDPTRAGSAAAAPLPAQACHRCLPTLSRCPLTDPDASSWPLSRPSLALYSPAAPARCLHPRLAGPAWHPPAQPASSALALPAPAAPTCAPSRRRRPAVCCPSGVARSIEGCSNSNL